MNITLKTLHLENFKGTADQTVEFSPHHVDIYGDNATGKTTVVDAFTWLLYGKDSRNAAAFSIKPLNADGTVRGHGLVTTVTALLDVDGNEVELKKTFREKWAKRRGSSTQEFAGHESKCYIDGIPKTIKAFNSYIAGLVGDETMFRILTSPEFFASTMDWRARRGMLMELCGEITDGDVLASNPQLSELSEMILRHGADDALAKLKSDRTKLSRERDAIPIRIDEASKTLAEIGGVNMAAEQQTIDGLTAQIDELESQIAQSRNSGIDPRVSELKAQIAAIRQQQLDDRQRALESYNSACAMHMAARGKLEDELTAARRALSDCTRTADMRDAETQRLREEYKRAAKTRWSGETTCPTCGQEIPSDVLEKRRADFNLQRSKTLEALAVKGKQAVAEADAARAEVRRLEDEAARIEQRLTELVPPKPIPEPPDSPQLKALIRELDRIETSADVPDTSGLETQLRDLRDERRAAERRIAAAQNGESVRARIDELDAQERKLSRALEKTERLIDLGETFIRTKVSLIEERVNSMFHVVQFKLYENQVNGGTAECCTVQVNGVDYQDINTAMRVNAGLDIINTLSEHYGISVPVFVDNAESIVNLIPMNGQMIRLIVSAPDKELRVEEVA